MNFHASAVVNKQAPKLNYEELKDEILGKEYELSLVFCGNALSHKLNKIYRDKDYPTNVLAFPISKTSGEIFINLYKLKGFSVPHLFIHGCLHLKGMQHGAKMERVEKQLLEHVTPTSRRNRYR